MSPRKKNIFERAAEYPAKELEKAIDEGEKIEKEIFSKKPFKKMEEYWNTLGPGLTTGASDDDPSGIATYSQTGARYGLQFIWLSLYTFPLMAVVQEMCARIGLVTGQGLAANIRHHFPRPVLYTSALLLFIANVFNIGADLGAMTQGVQLLFPGASFTFIIIGITLLSLLLQIFTTYARYAKFLKYLALILLSYVASALLTEPKWGEIFHALAVPHITFSKDALLIICAVLGTTISPYLFFWQTSQEVEEEILQGKTTVALRKKATQPDEIKKMRIDVWNGMFLSNLVMFFIIAACAGTLFQHGITDIKTAGDAAMALRPLAGDKAYILFAIGIIGTGLLAIPVLSGSTSYAISESFGWKYGLYRKLKEAYAFYGVIIIAMLMGLAMNFLHIDAMKALIYSAVANGMIAPVILILILKLSGDKKIMGSHVNGKIVSGIGWFATAIMTIAGVATFISFFY